MSYKEKNVSKHLIRGLQKLSRDSSSGPLGFWSALAGGAAFLVYGISIPISEAAHENEPRPAVLSR